MEEVSLIARARQILRLEIVDQNCIRQKKTFLPERERRIQAEGTPLQQIKQRYARPRLL